MDRTLKLEARRSLWERLTFDRPHARGHTFDDNRVEHDKSQYDKDVKSEAIDEFLTKGQTFKTIPSKHDNLTFLSNP
jgi:hypothetical protein